MLRDGALLIGAAIGTILGIGALTLAEGFWARSRLVPSDTASLSPPTGLFGQEHSGAPLNLALLGDSLAVGYGSDEPSDTVGVMLATGLAAAAGRPVQLSNVGRVGAESADLPAQLRSITRSGPAPDVAVIIIGANDVMHLKRLVDALQPLRATVSELHRMGVETVVATCPDLGTVRPFFQPLRFFAHWLSRLLATSQTIVVLRAGGRTVSLADTLGPLFHHDPTTMFSTLDHLHPSGLGYAQAARVLLPSVRAAAGFPTSTDAAGHRIYRKGSRHPLAWLAFRASRRTGMELRRVGGAEGATVGVERDAGGTEQEVPESVQ